MSIVVVEGPEPFISLETGKQHLQVEHNETDQLITLYIAGVCRHIDGPNTWLGHAVGEQVVEFRQADWCGLDPLPAGPLLEVLSVECVAADGSIVTIPDSDYVVTARGIEFLRAASLPALRGDSEGVRVRCVLGYLPDSLPADIKAYGLLMLGDLYRNRGTTGPDAQAIQMAAPPASLLAHYQNWNR